MSNTECILNDEQLINKSFELVKKLCDTGGKSWTLRVPVDFNSDPDMVFVELGNRLKQKNERIADLLEALKVCWASLQTYGEHPIIKIQVDAAISKAVGV